MDRGQGARNTTIVNVQTLLEGLLNMSTRYSCFTDESSYLKKQNFWSWGYSYQVLDYQDFRIIGHQRLKECCCIFVYLGCDIEENVVPYPFVVISKYIYYTFYFLQMKQAD
jgi:hypothetical protein